MEGFQTCIRCWCCKGRQDKLVHSLPGHSHRYRKWKRNMYVSQLILGDRVSHDVIYHLCNNTLPLLAKCLL